MSGRRIFAQNAPAGFISLFDGKSLNGWTGVPDSEWIVRDSSIAMTGDSRGFIYTHSRYTSYRIIFSVRQIKGKDHWPCVLVFGYDPRLDAMGAIQFQLPKDWTWDYRPGKNNSGKGFFSWPDSIPAFNKTDWARCEILVDAATGTARTAVAQPIGSAAIAFTVFKDSAIRDIPTAFGIQSHNKGQFDEYKDIIIEENPKIKDLLTVLAAPSDLRAIATATQRVELAWTDNTKLEDGDLIERSSDSLHWVTVARTKADLTRYVDIVRDRNSLYYYRVSAFNAVAVSNYTSARERK